MKSHPVLTIFVILVFVASNFAVSAALVSAADCTLDACGILINESEQDAAVGSLDNLIGTERRRLDPSHCYDFTVAALREKMCNINMHRPDYTACTVKANDGTSENSACPFRDVDVFSFNSVFVVVTKELRQGQWPGLRAVNVYHFLDPNTFVQIHGDKIVCRRYRLESHDSHQDGSGPDVHSIPVCGISEMAANAAPQQNMRNAPTVQKASAATEPVASTCNFPRILRRGSSGDDVRRAQQLLTAAGFEVAADGDFGEHTQEAVVQFQHSKRLAADGELGPNSAAALCSAASNNNAPTVQKASP